MLLTALEGTGQQTYYSNELGVVLNYIKYVYSQT